MRVSICVYIHVRMYTHVCLDTSMHVQMPAYMYMRMYMCTYSSQHLHFNDDRDKMVCAIRIRQLHAIR